MRLGMALIMLGTSGEAGTLCDDLDALQSGTLVLPQGVASCTPSLALGGARNLHCALDFPYRSPAARDAFEAILDDLAQCLGPSATQTIDQSVSHPDAYELHEFDLDGRSFGVSIKDKGALQQTLVFVRVEMR